MDKEKDQWIRNLYNITKFKEWKPGETKVLGPDFLPHYISFLHGVVREIGSLIYGLEAAKGGEDFSKAREFIQGKKKQRPTFSDYYELQMWGSKASFNLELEDMLSKGCDRDGNEFAFCEEAFYLYPLDFFDPGFEFSEEPELLRHEIWDFLLLLLVINDSYTSTWEPKDLPSELSNKVKELEQRKGVVVGQEFWQYIKEYDEKYREFTSRVRKDEVVQATMKIIFHAGKMIERVKQEGRKRSDRPAEIGRLPRKNTIGYQDVIEAFWKIDTKGMTNHAICQAVRESLLEREFRRGDKARTVYSVKQIGRILKEELEKK